MMTEIGGRRSGLFSSLIGQMASVQAACSLKLDAGSWVMEGNAITLCPPAVALFDQIVEWLWRKAPPPDPTRPGMRIIGIGSAALCLRWGTYLAALLDESKPLDPHARLPEFSMISDDEMKRINIEFSSNLARLIQLLHEDEERFYRLVCLSYRYLPMPRVRSLQSTRVLDSFTGLTSPDFYMGAQPELRERMDRIRPATRQYPYRIIANGMAVACYRNGPVENLHAGRAQAYSPDHRRATDPQIRELMEFTSGQLASVLAKFRPWKKSSGHPLQWPENIAGIYLSPYFSPSNWSLSESCCPIRLEARIPTCQ
jgi:hypothetical protein